MRALTSPIDDGGRQSSPDAPKLPPSPPIATSQRDLVVWSLLVCPAPAKARP